MVRAAAAAAADGNKITQQLQVASFETLSKWCLYCNVLYFTIIQPSPKLQSDAIAELRLSSIPTAQIIHSVNNTSLIIHRSKKANHLLHTYIPSRIRWPQQVSAHVRMNQLHEYRKRPGQHSTAEDDWMSLSCTHEASLVWLFPAAIGITLHY